MATFPPSLTEALRSLQRQIDQINTARPGPMSWGPDDGSIRFYKANGDVWFEADTDGARVESRGVVTGLTPLLDSIRALDDNQNDQLTNHREWLIGHNEQLTDHRGRLDGHDSRLGTAEGRLDGHDGTLASHGSRLGSAEGRLDGHDGTLSSHNTRISAAQSRADTGVANASTAQSRADSAYSRAGVGISDAATAKSRADAAYALASGGASSGDVASLADSLNAQLNVLRARVQALEEWRQSLPQG